MSAGQDVPPFPSSNAGSQWRLTALGIGVALTMLVFGTLALIEARADTWQQAKQSSRNLLLALDRDIVRNITILDLSLQGVIEAMAEPGISEAREGIRRHALFDRSATAEDLGSIMVEDVNGVVVEDSTNSHTTHPTNDDPDSFMVHRDRPDAGLFVSRVFASRSAGGDLRIAISRRVPTQDGSFAGLVSASLRLTYFRRLFEQLELGKHGTITLLRSDGRILFQYPSVDRDIDRNVSRDANFRRFADEQSGQYVAVVALDGIERLITFKHLDGLPLILAVNRSVADINAAWWRKALVIGPALLLLCLANVASCLLFHREVQRRAKIEIALAAAAEQLAITASTDGLTGLLNRRAFDEEFGRAFRLAIRSGSTISALMLDADYFKRYNDHYGHTAGDEVLQAIANGMRAQLRRPSDLAARYGGEEFVALLPDTELPAAVMIADRIRQAVEDLALEHAGSPLARVTVSIGVAAICPFVGDDGTQLIQAADMVLYAAKAAGRNCVRSHDTQPGSGPELFLVGDIPSAV